MTSINLIPSLYCSSNADHTKRAYSKWIKGAQASSDPCGKGNIYLQERNPSCKEHPLSEDAYAGEGSDQEGQV
ncbi:hypothetical protein TIFTF001_031103 [Ficus carica]|uniref:Uncharacterized protein n=1 Tax=Ficus carica TaxID=3494 RepID=A0AA88DUM9_FICCA|nr:hypothetical protein TIFTF001_031103 [Ficus carica]